MNKLIALAAMTFASLPVLATPVNNVPTPETLPLLAIGAIGGLTGWFLSRNKRK